MILDKNDIENIENILKQCGVVIADEKAKQALLLAFEEWGELLTDNRVCEWCENNR